MASRSFSSLSNLVKAMEADVRRATTNTAPIMKHAGGIVKTHAQAQLGHYLDHGGPYPGEPWKHLADSTLAQKVADTPLVETGALHDAIEVHADVHEAQIGVKSSVGEHGVDIGDIAVWQEFGTLTKGGHVPPRPFLGPALHEEQEHIGKYITEALFRRLR